MDADECRRLNQSRYTCASICLEILSGVPSGIPLEVSLEMLSRISKKNLPYFCISFFLRKVLHEISPWVSPEVIMGFCPRLIPKFVQKILPGFSNVVAGFLLEFLPRFFLNGSPRNLQDFFGCLFWDVCQSFTDLVLDFLPTFLKQLFLIFYMEFFQCVFQVFFSCKQLFPRFLAVMVLRFF